MTPKQIALIIVNVVLVIGAIALVCFDKITWPTAEAFIVGQLVPSVWGAFSRAPADERPTDPDLGTKIGKIPPLPVLLIAIVLFGCAAAKAKAAEAQYREEQEACLRQYADLELKKACVDKVRAEWSDGGAK